MFWVGRLEFLGGRIVLLSYKVIALGLELGFIGAEDAVYSHIF